MNTRKAHITRHHFQEPEHEINLRNPLSSSLYYEAQIMTNCAGLDILLICLVICVWFYDFHKTKHK